MKKCFKRALFVLCVSLFVLSCDTRDDYFYEHSEEPIIHLQSENDTTMDGKRYICVDIHWGESIKIDYTLEDQYGGIGDVYYKIVPMYNNRLDGYYWKEFSQNFTSYWNLEPHNVGTLSDLGKEYLDQEGRELQFSENLSFMVDKESRQIVISENTKSAQQFYENYINYSYREYNVNSPIGLIVSENQAPQRSSETSLIESRIELYVTNKLGKVGSVNILLNIHYNKPPIPCLTVTENFQIDSLSRKISIVGNDPNKDDIVKYEFLIDPYLVEKSSYEVSEFGGYDSEYFSKEIGFLRSDGLVANVGYYGEYEKVIMRGGVRVHSTSLSSINHVFQTKGTHTIYFRCMDKWGLWCQWQKYEFVI